MSDNKLNPQFLDRVRSCIPDETRFLHIGSIPHGAGMLESSDGKLLRISSGSRSTSTDGGVTWSPPEPVTDLEGNPIVRGISHLLRLKSGGIGGLYDKSEPDKQYGLSPWFVKSDDEGKIWSQPVQVGEPYNNAVMHGAIVTSTGRIVVSVYKLLGKTVWEKGRALFGDDIALVGHHGYEHFFTYCWAYYSDDEGKTWKANKGTGVWGAGAELFVTLDYSAGGHYRCNEPVVAEVSPNHLLMILRTPLGRFYQSWSADNGTSWSRPEPTALASALAPAALGRIPGSDDLLIIWNQASGDEIQRGMQRHRLSSAVSRDAGATWRHTGNVFSIFLQEGDTDKVEPSPIQPYRALEHAPRLPPNDLEGTYPYLSFCKDTAIISFMCREREYYIVDSEKSEDEFSGGEHGITTSVCVGIPISWFYKTL